MVEIVCVICAMYGGNYVCYVVCCDNYHVIRVVYI